MTPKERAAMQQALEALENERSHMTANWDNIVKAITALRETLAEPDMNLNCKSVQARLAASWGYVKAEQAEQEPVAWNDLDEDELAHKLGWRIGDPLYMTIVGIGQEAIHHFKAQNTAPVRTKDLTDNEINKISNTIANVMPANMTVEDWKRSFARAVIAAYKEKNK